MSYHDHSLRFDPRRQRPIYYRTRRTLLQRLRVLILGVLGVGAIALMVLGVVTLIAQFHATQAQLDAAHLQGMAVGQTMCGGRP